MLRSPYEGKPSQAFWRTGVSDVHISHTRNLYSKKFAITAADRIATAGSCFAQHISRNMRARGFQVYDAEPAPIGLSAAHATKYSYGVYSARFGNIYTVAQLLQLTLEAFGKVNFGNETTWEKNGRFFDAFRPAVEPEGLASPQEVQQHREAHLMRVNKMLRNASVFVFTMGLTEAWLSSESGAVFPTAPGTVAGHYDPAKVHFKNYEYEEIKRDFERFRRLILRVNPGARFILTVSPVPLTATASEEHVLSATIYSKSVLRAVAGALARTHADVDYFPSYEIIASHPARGQFYHPNLRSVLPIGVEVVMRTFFAEHSLPTSLDSVGRAKSRARDRSDVHCEEALLEAFA